VLQYKQTAREIVDRVPDVATDGCLLLSLADVACTAVGKEIYPNDIERLYWYAIPKYMEQGDKVEENKCLILDHEEIIRIAGMLAGHRLRDVEYRYRKDGSRLADWSCNNWDSCNYFVAKVPYKKSGHFLRVIPDGNDGWETLYNPGVTDGERISIRGYYVRY